MMNWKDSTKYIFQTGDHNGTHRASDSLHNQGQHLQPALIKHMKINGLSDDFLNVHGDIIMFSRITNVSSTIIDYILEWSYLAELFRQIICTVAEQFRQIICTVAEQFRHGANYLTEPQNCPKIPVVLGS